MSLGIRVVGSLILGLFVLLLAYERVLTAAQSHPSSLVDQPPSEAVSAIDVAPNSAETISVQTPDPILAESIPADDVNLEAVPEDIQPTEIVAESADVLLQPEAEADSNEALAAPQLPEILLNEEDALVDDSIEEDGVPKLLEIPTVISDAPPQEIPSIEDSSDRLQFQDLSEEDDQIGNDESSNVLGDAGEASDAAQSDAQENLTVNILPDGEVFAGEKRPFVFRRSGRRIQLPDGSLRIPFREMPADWVEANPTVAYPEYCVASANDIETVVVRFRIDQFGRADAPKAALSTNRCFNNAAIDAASQAAFKVRPPAGFALGGSTFLVAYEFSKEN